MKFAVIKGAEFCQGALYYMSEELVKAFKSLGHDATMVELTTSDAVVDLFCDNSYDAIIGLQHSSFTREMSFGHLSELSSVPKFNVIFDSPSWARFIFRSPARNVYYLYHDEQYMDFVKENYPGLPVFHFPLGGSQGSIAGRITDNGNSGFSAEDLCSRQYDVTFIGTFNDYHQYLERSSDEKRDYLLDYYFNLMISNPNLPAQKCYRKMLEELKIEASDDKALDILSVIYPAESAAFSYYREKVMSELLDNGVKIDVFSPSWEQAPFARHNNLIIHPEVQYTDSFDVMAQSKLSLNIFSWHKGGMTERISNILLNGAVCVSDRSSYLDKHFVNDKEMVLFDLTDTRDVAKRITELLSDDNKRINIAISGYDKAKDEYSWTGRARHFIKILESLRS